MEGVEDASEDEASEEDASEEPVLGELLDVPVEELLADDPLALVVELTAAFLLEADRAGSLPEASCT